jgi:23S rRNA pseudouridine2605 synthase
VSSRRGADKLIQAERVKVNGKPGQLNDEVSENDLIELDGRKIQSQRLRYILLNKPDRTITTLSDPQDRPKVTDLIDIPERVVPVGRLDFDTTGVLLLTNDGELAHKLMHPSFEVDKTYEAKVQGTITSKILNTLSNGVELEDGKTAPAKTRKLSENKIELTIHEGRNHQVKRMLEAVGLDTRRLHRSRYGKLGVESLKPGQWRDLTLAEINGLKN